MQSYLDQSYLGESSVQLEAPPPAAVMVPEGQQLADELIELPGGIVISKKALLIAAVAAAAFLLYMATRNKNK